MDHVKVLDGLRAIAVLIVIVSHSGLGHIVPGGFGVTMFFFLSGFLITMLMIIEIEKAHSLDFRGFYLRRTVRIVPPLLLCIAATLLLANSGFLKNPIQYEGLIWDFLFLSNYAAQITVSSMIPIPLWSLAVEEHFYLLFPMLFAIMWRARGRNGVLLTVVGLIIATLTLRLILVAQGSNIELIYYWSHTRADSILFGSLLALFNNPLREDRTLLDDSPIYFVIGCGLIMLTFVVRDVWFRETLRYSMQGVALFLVFNYLLRTDNLITALLSSGPFKTVANYSYVLYLIHMPLITAGLVLFETSWRPMAILAGIAASFAFAALSYRYLEQPLLAWRKDFAARLKVNRELRPKGLE